MVWSWSYLLCAIFIDKALRASYTPSPLHRPMTGGTKTPKYTTKKGGPTSTRTPKTFTPHEKRPSSPNVDLTANLLNLPSKRKPKAADFF